MTDFATLPRRWGILGLGLLAIALVATGCDSFTEKDLGDSNPQTPTIAAYVQEVPALSSLETAVAEAGLVGTLESGGPFTVFAPTDEAFAPPIDPSLNRQVTEKVVRHHVVNGEVLSTQLSDGQTVTPLAGDDLTIGVGETVTVNRATVTNPDANASNGVVHVVDKLLADAVDRATLTPRFTIFARLVKEADLESALRGSGPNDGLTIFAPTNDALLELLDADGNGEVESDEIPSNAAEVLQYHVLDSVFLAADVPTSETAVETLEGSDVTVVRDGNAVTLNPNDENASVTTPNVEVDNGVIHGIDTVLIP
ncbi:MAG: fasciclin domain-containing protein [Salinibacter sp.]